MADYREGLHLVPDHMHDAVRMWIEDPCHPTSLGSFFKAILTNDLMSAFAHADDINVQYMRAWVLFLYNYMPAGSYGSMTALYSWHGAYERLAADRKAEAEANQQLGDRIDEDLAMMRSGGEV